MIRKKDKDNRESERKPVLTDLEFCLDPHIMQAMSVDISGTGIRFDTGQPLNVRMQLEIDDQLQERKAKLVWIKHTPDGGMTYGFEYISDPDKP